MSMGAYRADKTTSNRTLAATPITPPLPRRMRLDTNPWIRPSILGISSTTMLNQNRVIINSTLKRGQVGNS